MLACHHVLKTRPFACRVIYDDSSDGSRVEVCLHISEELRVWQIRFSESKLCLDNMSDSTATTASTPRQSGHGTSPEDLARIGSEKLSQSLELINLHNHGSMSGSLSRFSAISRSVPKINGYIDSPEDSSLILQLVEDLVSQIQSSYGVALSEAEGLSCDSRQVLERWLADTDNAENSTQVRVHCGFNVFFVESVNIS